MKLIWFLGCFLLALASFKTQAQDITYRHSVIYYDGKPYAYLFRDGSAWAREFSFQNLKTEMQDDDDFRRRLAYEFALFRVLENDTLNPEAVKKFIAKYPPKRFSTSKYISH